GLSALLLPLSQTWAQRPDEPSRDKAAPTADRAERPRDGDGDRDGDRDGDGDGDRERPAREAPAGEKENARAKHRERILRDIDAKVEELKKRNAPVYRNPKRDGED